MEEPPLYSVEVTESVTSNLIVNQIGAADFEVVANEELQGQGANEPRSTRHIEVALPEGVSYAPGDHLCVAPMNRPEVVDRMLDRFGLSEDSQLKIESRSEMRGPFPSGTTFSAKRLTETAGELQAVASRRNIGVMARYTQCPDTRARLLALAEPANNGRDLYREEVLEKRKSILDLLEEYPACEMPLAIYLEIATMMNPRYYSISSSPLAAPDRCSITVSVVKGPALSGNGQFEGTCSNYLAGLKPGDKIQAVVKPPTAEFRLPKDPSTPVLMIGPGTGLAPFRGFLQERAALKAKGADLGDAMLFFGCRHPEQDFYYRSELEAFAADGVVDLNTAFSRHNGTRKYVQDLIEERKDDVWALIDKGANIYICGDGARMEPGVREVLARIYAEKAGGSVDDGQAWLDELTASDRYLLDVWAG